MTIDRWESRVEIKVRGWLGYWMGFEPDLSRNRIENCKQGGA